MKKIKYTLWCALGATLSPSFDVYFQRLKPSYLSKITFSEGKECHSSLPHEAAGFLSQP
jgi:hypothetical protein